MQVYVYIKHKKDQSESGMQPGDICYVYPMVADQGRLTLTTYFPVVMDLNIPCGQGQVEGMDFNTLKFRCVGCPCNNPTECDAIKYKSANWSDGDILNPPKVRNSRRYYVSLDEVMTTPQKDKRSKAKVYSAAKRSVQTKDSIKAKR